MGLVVSARAPPAGYSGVNKHIQCSEGDWCERHVHMFSEWDGCRVREFQTAFIMPSTGSLPGSGIYSGMAPPGANLRSRSGFAETILQTVSPQPNSNSR